MENYLSNINKIAGSKKRSKRLGRGISSGKGGHQASRGNKGQKSRSGGKVKIWFEGGQTPLIKRMPYIKGFNRFYGQNDIAINLKELEDIMSKTNTINIDTLVKNQIINDANEFKSIKIIGNGKIENKINFSGFKYSKIAKEKIEKAGGKAE